jgi:hypothetical protein
MVSQDRLVIYLGRDPGRQPDGDAGQDPGKETVAR